MPERVKWTAVLTLVVGISLVGSMAPASTQARVAGVVVDSSGAPIQGATITVTCPESASYKKVLESDARGQFKILLLDATKSYIFTTEAPGYAGDEQEIKVGVGTMENEFTVQLQSQQESAAAERDAIFEQPGYKEYKEGRELFNAGDLDGARVKYAEAVAAVADIAPAWAGLADIDYRNEDYSSAMDNAKACLEYDDESAKCLAIAANSAKQLGDAEAEALFMHRYQELNPDDPTSLFNQAAEYLNALDDDKARPLLEQCLEIDPDFPACLFEYGMVLLRAGDLEGAKAQLNKYLEVAPDGKDAVAASETVKYL
jgi:tetratricopeptide (TPR) repeat protein